MSVDPRRADTYLRHLMKMSEDSPDKLSSTERRVTAKIRSSQQRASQINSELSQLRDQITQGEARVRSLELQAKSEEGKIQGLLDFVVEEKFDEDDLSGLQPGDSSPPVEAAPAPGPEVAPLKSSKKDKPPKDAKPPKEIQPSA